MDDLSSRGVPYAEKCDDDASTLFLDFWNVKQ